MPAQMSLAGNQTLRQYEQSMLPHRPESGRSASFFSARRKESRSTRARSARPLLTALGLAAPLLLLAQLLISCGSDDDGSVCNAGDLHMCVCTGDRSGTQACKDDGSG